MIAHVAQALILLVVLAGATAVLVAVVADEMRWWRRERPTDALASWQCRTLECRTGGACDVHATREAA